MRGPEARMRPGDGEERERALLVGVRWGETTQEAAEESLLELGSLAETAGAEVVGTLAQARQRPDAATFLGRGKLDELASLLTARGAELVIFDQELAPSQQRNLENRLAVKVLDRTALILDIFALHAHSKEGKAQVEMAQLKYALTRLTGKGVELSRLGGGIGTRGPGETQLEVDRRRIKSRIRTLDRELRDLSRMRGVKRKRRDRRAVSSLALVGYTNAGKSSILNYLTGARATVENQLFSTLDPMTRRLELPTGGQAVLTDTVGFISQLPHQLVEAFKSTLEEVVEAAALLHVVDASARDVEHKVEAVEEVLRELGALEIPTLHILNKSDLLREEDRTYLRRLLPEGVFTSTVSGEGMKELMETISALLSPLRHMRLMIPHERGELLALIHARGRLLSAASDARGHRVVAEIPREISHLFAPYEEDGELGA